MLDSLLVEAGLACERDDEDAWIRAMERLEARPRTSRPEPKPFVWDFAEEMRKTQEAIELAWDALGYCVIPVEEELEF